MGLSSGGLDSILASVLLQQQGIEVENIAFETPFFSSEKARQASKITGIPLTIENITKEYMKMLKNPPCGYGKNMNPCMDCHALMFKLAGRVMLKKGFDFLFSGEVVGQRPMSQMKPALRYVEKHSGFDGYILRPLSAALLDESIMEKDGRVNRSMLLDISGRSRKRQIELAKQYGIKKYPTPGGGCLLTDKGFSARLKDFFQHPGSMDDCSETCDEDELHLLKYGRHLRLNENKKIIIGRNQKENEIILKYYKQDVDFMIRIKDFSSPCVLVPQGCGKDTAALAASICAGYTKAPEFTPVEAIVQMPDGLEIIKVIGIPPADIKHFII